MIFLLVGEAGAGKTTIAKTMEKFVPNSFVIDGDELRSEFKNFDLSENGRSKNMIIGLSRARRLSDLGFTVFVSMQAPIKEIRNKYLNEWDKVILVENKGENPKEFLNKNFNPDYSDVTEKIILQEFTPEYFAKKFFPKVLVPARFQGFHKGHKIVLEEAKRLSPDITIALRQDPGDPIPKEKNIKFLKELLEQRDYHCKIIESPDLNDEEGWLKLSEEYDILVQGNPMVYEKFDLSKIKHYFVPRYGDISATKIRNNLYEMDYAIDKEVKEFMNEIVN